MKAVLLLILFAILSGSAVGQTQEPITKDRLFSSIQLGKRDKMTAARYVELIKQTKVDFRLTEDDIQHLRRIGGYLGAQGLDDLLTAIRENYVSDKAPAKPRIKKELPRVGKDGEPLTLVTGIEINGGLELSYIAELIKSAGHKINTSVMSVLVIKNNDESVASFNVTTRAEANRKEISQALEPGNQFEFPSGTNAAKTYVFAMGAVKVDIAFKPMPIESLALRDWLETDEAKQLVAQMINDVEKLADEGRVMDLTDYKKAVKIYNEWVEKCSVALGRLDIQMRRFGKQTFHKVDWDKHDKTWRDVFSDESRNKSMLRNDLNSAVLELDSLKHQIKLDTILQTGFERE